MLDFRPINAKTTTTITIQKNEFYSYCGPRSLNCKRKGTLYFKSFFVSNANIFEKLHVELLVKTCTLTI
jgi:hypothetical protein